MKPPRKLLRDAAAMVAHNAEVRRRFCAAPPWLEADPPAWDFPRQVPPPKASTSIPQMRNAPAAPATPSGLTKSK